MLPPGTADSQCLAAAHDAYPAHAPADLRGHFRVRHLAEQRQLLLRPARAVIALRQVLREGVLAAYLAFFLRESLVLTTSAPAWEAA
jgi:hypothetical protein